MTSCLFPSPTSALAVVAVFLTTGVLSEMRRAASEEEALLRDLFSEYNPSARPVMNSSNTVSVGIQFSLMHIKELDVRSQVLTTTGLLILEWQDERLQWNPADYGNMAELIIEADRLWRPEFAVINGAEKIYENYSNFRAIVSHKGMIRWEPGGVFKTMCTIDITYYPFDEQVCELMFGAWSYHTSKMNLTNTSDAINMDSYSTNGEWQMLNTDVERREFAYGCCPNEKFANVAFSIYIRRRHTFYILNVILPSILTSVLLLSIFFCTPGQKVQIGVVVLLSFRIFLLNVAGNIPKTSDHIPLLGIYLTCTMAITTLSMVLTVFVLNLHHVTDRPVPLWLHRLVLVYIAKLVGKCSASTTPGGGQDSRSIYKARDQHSVLLLQQQQQKVQQLETVEAPVDNSVKPSSSSCRRAQLRIVQSGDDNQCSSAILEIRDPASADSGVALRENGTQEPLISGGSRSEAEGGHWSEDSRVDFSRDWRKVAEVFDRLFFWFFLLAILISTLVLFHPLTDTYLKIVL